MSQVIQLLLRVLGVLSQILSVLGIVQSQGAKTAQENSPFEIDTATQETLAIVEDGTFGNQALRNTIDTNAALATLQYDDLVTRIEAVQQASAPVILPTTPPAGYGGSGGDVWLEELGSYGTLKRAGDLLTSAGNLADFLSAVSAQLPMYYPGGWQVGGTWNDNEQADPNVNYPPQFDPTTIIEADATLPDWIGRAYPDAGVTYNSSGQPQISAFDGSWVYTYAMGESEFQQYKAAKFGVAATIPGLLPLWPGLSEATLSGPFDWSTNSSLFGDMHGVLVTVSAVPPGAQLFQFNGFASFRHIGSIGFQSDNGDWEYPQLLGPDTAIYTPRTMVKAVRCDIHPYQGVSGTWTGFLRTT